MNFEPGPDGVVRISFEIADLKTWVQIPVGAPGLLFIFCISISEYIDLLKEYKIQMKKIIVKAVKYQ